MSEATLIPSQRSQSALAIAVESLRTIRREKAELDAFEAVLMQNVNAIANDIGDEAESARSREMAHRLVLAEVAAAVNESDRAVAIKVGRGTTLVEEYPIVHALLRQGELSLQHAHIIVAEGAIITDPIRRDRYERAIVDIAAEETVGRVRQVARRFAESFATRSIDDRAEEARAGRCVAVTDREDGMSDLIARLPAAYAHGIMDRLNQFAQQLHEGDVQMRREARVKGVSDEEIAELSDGRTRDHQRADVLTDLLLTGQPEVRTTAKNSPNPPIHARVQLIVPRDTLNGKQGSRPTAAILDGYGPIDGATARDLVATAQQWERVQVDSKTGDVLTVDAYRPSAALRRFIGARDQRCRFRGCNVPVRKCDIDHTVAAADGGPTSSDNLGALCRRHHTLKHATPWLVRQLSGGVYEWTSPTGRSYRDEPGSRVRFRPPDPPPLPAAEPPRETLGDQLTDYMGPSDEAPF